MDVVGDDICSLLTQAGCDFPAGYFSVKILFIIAEQQLLPIFKIVNRASSNDGAYQSLSYNPSDLAKSYLVGPHIF